MLTGDNGAEVVDVVELDVVITGAVEVVLGGVVVLGVLVVVL